MDAERPYAELAAAIMWPYVAGSIERDRFDALVADTYATFDHPDVVPVRRVEDGLYLAELFWGPTLAFKDVALQLVGRLFDHELGRRDARSPWWAPRPATLAPPPSRPCATAPRWTASSCTCTAGCRRCSAGR
ncbi:MAG: hypothetical protein R2755_33405 [Acidimicrobiales bacterium]